MLYAGVGFLTLTIIFMVIHIVVTVKTGGNIAKYWISRSIFIFLGSVSSSVAACFFTCARQIL